MSYQSILNNISRHISLTDDEATFFKSLLTPKEYKRKSLVLRAGQVCHHEYFVNKGCLRTSYTDEQGNEHVSMFAVEDWWAGDLYSLFTGQPSIYDIEAIEDTEVLEISKNDLEMLYVKVPKFERFFRILFQNAYVVQQYRIIQNLSFNAEQRYMEFVKKYPTLEQRISQKQIAAFLGITPEFMSKLKKKMLKG
ncbi:MAG: Crp/Fnr family transcriptional regulator [Bacteroidota bacterium]